ncbi:hypothetical protein BJ508DRAFT_332226 [Ascobolus immersus RN42]|uniref:Uncharacterized protein n=1 Tax=Ascobolus immersus RN42 TaxID=1160509 RepID=A0A3N4HQS5_ASCIM|nr:hypothetical protein BJ508DRAFT_332226 [Ascobolus immersus RN42]
MSTGPPREGNEVASGDSEKVALNKLIDKEWLAALTAIRPPGTGPLDLPVHDPTDDQPVVIFCIRPILKLLENTLNHLVLRNDIPTYPSKSLLSVEYARKSWSSLTEYLENDLKNSEAFKYAMTNAFSPGSDKQGPIMSMIWGCMPGPWRVTSVLSTVQVALWDNVLSVIGEDFDVNSSYGVRDVVADGMPSTQGKTMLIAFQIMATFIGIDETDAEAVKERDLYRMVCNSIVRDLIRDKVLNCAAVDTPKEVLDEERKDYEIEIEQLRKESIEQLRNLEGGAVIRDGESEVSAQG